MTYDNNKHGENSLTLVRAGKRTDWLRGLAPNVIWTQQIIIVKTIHLIVKSTLEIAFLGSIKQMLFNVFGQVIRAECFLISC
jgi:hypothetical protein